jgi:peptidoglycan/xylan/chitin deacetylase (PgdA/CDA1 family)
MTKNRLIYIDIIIAILIVVMLILVDHLVMNWRSRPADEDWSKIGINGQDEQGQEVFDRILDGERAFLPILNFHHIGIAPAKSSAVSKSFYIESDKFEAMIKGLLDEGYQSVFVSEAVDYLQQKQLPKQKIMSISFDDGNEDFYTNAWPILQKLNVKASMYLMTGVRGKDWLTVDQILELNDTGLVEFGSHTVWHPKLTKISAEEQAKELTDSKEFLEKLLNKKSNILAYPFGLYNEEIKAQTKTAGYAAGLTFDQDAWQDPDDLFALTRISVYPELNVSKFLEKLKNQY